jgi:hypothetical protein
VGCITQTLEPNSFVLVKFTTKKTVKYFVGPIEEMLADGYNIKFLKKCVGHFVFQRLKTLQ